jgi:hypothetical protein
MSICDDDRAAARHFSRVHARPASHGRPIAGTSASIHASLRKAGHYKRYFVSGNVIVGMAGAVTPERVRAGGDVPDSPRGKAERRVPPPNCSTRPAHPD